MWPTNVRLRSRHALDSFFCHFCSESTLACNDHMRLHTVIDKFGKVRTYRGVLPVCKALKSIVNNNGYLTISRSSSPVSRFRNWNMRHGLAVKERELQTLDREPDMPLTGYFARFAVKVIRMQWPQPFTRSYCIDKFGKSRTYRGVVRAGKALKKYCW